MTTVAYKEVVMAGPMRWIVLTTRGRATTLAWFVKVCYTVHGSGTVLFARTDLAGNGHDDLFAVFGDNLAMAEHLRDDIFDYTDFARVPHQREPAPLVQAAFESRDDFPASILESMRAVDGTCLDLSFYDLGPPRAYLRQVNETVIEVGAFSVPATYSLTINDVAPVGQPEAGPIAEAPPLGADLQNVWYRSR
jgi:hypothetical protein